MKQVEKIWAELSANASTELSAEEVKVELASIDELKSQLYAAKALESSMVDHFMDARNAAKVGVDNAEGHLRNLKTISNMVEDIKTSANELGIDPKSIAIFNQANSFLNQNPVNATNKMLERMKGLL